MVGKAETLYNIYLLRTSRIHHVSEDKSGMIKIKTCKVSSIHSWANNINKKLV